LITVEAAAEILGISKRMMYALAAPHGPIPCIRYTAKCIRFSPDDIKAYIDSCRCTPLDLVKEAGPARLTTVTLRALPAKSRLQQLFLEKGIAATLRPNLKVTKSKIE
jgi:hypothetical protein